MKDNFLTMRSLVVVVTFILFINAALFGKISYTGLYTGTTSDGWNMWFNINSLDRAGFLRYNLNTGQALMGQPLLEEDGSFDFVNLSFRYTGQVTENTFQGQITQQGKQPITFSGTRKSDFGKYRDLRGS